MRGAIAGVDLVGLELAFCHDHPPNVACCQQPPEQPVLLKPLSVILLPSSESPLHMIKSPLELHLDERLRA